MSDAQPLTQDEIQALPRWARLALAARCVRRAVGLLRAPAEQKQIIERAVALTEEAARTGHAGDELADAAAAAYTLVLNTLDEPDTARPPAVEDDAAIVTCIVAHAAAFAAEAATLASPRMAAYLAAQSISSALQAHVAADPNSTHAILAAMRADWERLRSVVY